MSEEQADYLADALEMVGAGYDHPAVEIEQPRTVIQRREGKLQAVDKPAFIKLSTDFKNELAGISGDALKVWIFVSLSINRKSGRANPGLRTIADGVGLAVNTVQKALKELEAANLLAVYRGERRYNLYEIPEYVSANRAEPTVSNRDTDLQTVSNPAETVSNSAQTVSPSVILNQSNQNNQKERADALLSEMPIEVQIMAGRKEITIPRSQIIQNALRDHFRLTPRWASKFDKEWMQWAISEEMTEEQVKFAAELWRSDKRFNWSTPTLKGIAEHWLELIEGMDAKPVEYYTPPKDDGEYISKEEAKRRGLAK